MTKYAGAVRLPSHIHESRNSRDPKEKPASINTYPRDRERSSILPVLGIQNQEIPNQNATQNMA